MTRETFVYESVVRGQQIDDIAIPGHDALEEQLCLALERLAQIIVEIRISADVGGAIL